MAVVATAISSLTNSRNYQPVSVDADAVPEDELETVTSPPTPFWHLVVSFWMLGLLNNASYVIMIACAKNISEGGTALVFLANVGPSMMVKLSAPYWFDHVSYKHRMFLATVAMVGSFSLVASNSSEDAATTSSSKVVLAWKLLGVALGSLQSGLGEASLLALAGKCDGEKSSSTDSKRQCLTCFSSGTGMAGVFGFFWKWLWNDLFGLPVSTMLWFAMVLPVGYWYTFRHVMKIESQLPPIAVASESSVPEDAAPSEESALANDVSLEASDAPQRIGHRTKIENMTAYQRFYFVVRLWPYIVPLFTVYASEYALQSGTWTAIGFPVDDVKSRDRFFQFSNWMYQAGVFLSRSSGTLWTAPIWILWLMPGLQCVNLALFSYVASHASTTSLYNPATLYFGAFYAGLLGGACYINAYTRICKDIALEYQEFALSSTSVGESLGIVVADILGLFIQACLYRTNGLDGAIVQCPL
ncbi:unnamed protein product [Cylindrotheca closterium]|uniref:Battenin n=1 Tax=Cylindrotheca closterium TaxID=2856 RepID=A0AAD2PUZ6_9STRA|nr:unnamed protein product [Cylindrotheca closterium]